MKPAGPVGVGCLIVGEFDDDASGFGQEAAEFVPVTGRPSTGPHWSPGAGLLPVPLSPFTEAAAAAARKGWLKIVRRFTEPVPGKKKRLRVVGSEPGNRGKIFVEFGGRFLWGGESKSPEKSASGCELEVTDKLF